MCISYSKEISFSELRVYSVQQWIFESTAYEDQHFCPFVAVPSCLQNSVIARSPSEFIVPVQTKVMAEDITATSKAGVLCPCQCTH